MLFQVNQEILMALAFLCRRVIAIYWLALCRAASKPIDKGRDDNNARKRQLMEVSG